MSKAAMSIAEKIALLRQIPPHLIPSTLKYNLKFPKFAQIKFEYAKSAKQLGPMLKFYRLYIADIRLNNPELCIVRQTKPDGPIIGRVIVKPKNSINSEMVLQGSKFTSEQQLRERLKAIHNELL